MVDRMNDDMVDWLVSDMVDGFNEGQTVQERQWLLL